MMGMLRQFTCTILALSFPFLAHGDIGQTQNTTMVMVLGADGRGETGKFKVAKVMNASVFGQMDEADRKFQDNATTATLAITGETLQVTFDCPVPKGMTAQKVNEPWNGDRVEFNVHPEIGGKGEACFAANCGGPYAAHGYLNGSRDMGWSSKSKIVVENHADGFRVSMTIPVRDAFGKIPEPGDAFGINFVRKGPTCGGLSAWSLEGGAFNTASERYGTLIFGGCGAYFRRRLASYDEKCARVSKEDDNAAAAVRSARASVEMVLSRHGNELTSFYVLERLLAGFEQDLVRIALRKTPLAIYDNVDVWGDEISPTIDSKPIEEIVLKAPRNTRRVKTLALANLTYWDFLGNLKVCDVPGRIYSRTPANERPKPGIQERFTLRRAVWMHRRNGSLCPDPLVELHLGSLVELGAKRTMPVYMEFDSRNMKPGEYQATLSLVSATAGLQSVNIPVKVVITDDDLNAVSVRHCAETHIHDTFRNGHVPALNCVKTFVSRGYNVVQLSRFDGLYPTLDQNGVWRKPDYSDIDRYLDAWIAGGLAKEKMYVRPYIGPERDQSASQFLWRGLRDAAGQRVPFASPEYERGARKLIEFFMAHMKERYGLRKNQVIWYPCDEPGGAIDDPECKSGMSRCLWYAKLIKSIDPEYPVFVCFSTDLFNTRPFLERIDGFGRLFDWVEVYRPKLSAEALNRFRSAPFRNKSTYHITGYEAPAIAYRKGAWMNLRDGFEPEANYWHCDESSYFAGHEHGYGTCYIDRDLDLMILSRRQLAADMAHQEGRLVKYLRAKFAHDPVKTSAIEAIVKEAADRPSMKALDVALEKLLEML